MVLPEPDSPTIPSTSPGKRSNSTFRQPTREPYNFVSPLTESSGVIAPAPTKVTEVKKARKRWQGWTRSDRVRTSEEPGADVINKDLVEEGIRGTAQPARLIPSLNGEGVVLEVEAPHCGVGRNGVDPLLPPGAEDRQRGQRSSFGLSNFGIGDGDMR